MSENSENKLQCRPKCKMHKYHQSKVCRPGLIILLAFGCFVNKVASYPFRHHMSPRVHRHHRGKIHDHATDKCPHPLRQIHPDACAQDPCSSDDECSSGVKCCFNSCLYTCTYPVEPPAVIDWLTPNSEDDNLDYYGENSFEILPGEYLASLNRDNIGNLCTTTIDKEFNIPLDCPHGYICHIEDKGDTNNGIPDRGRCVKTPQHVDLLPEDNLG